MPRPRTRRCDNSRSSKWPIIFGPRRRVRRNPLQELPLTVGGSLRYPNRERLYRELPSKDKENLMAIEDAIAYNVDTLKQLEEDVLTLERESSLFSLQVEEERRRMIAEQHRQTLDSDDPSEPSRGGFGFPADSEEDTDMDMAAIDAARANVEIRAEDYVGEGQHVEGGDAAQDEEQEHEPEPQAPFDPAALGLKEISNLGKFTVSSHKQGNGVAELRSEDLKLYWQSDGPQPHKLTVYFVKRVGIRLIRFFVDFADDESYTPTKIVFKSGTSENNLIDFAVMELNSPVGWQNVPISSVGGGPDGNTLVSYVLQMQILENHQNGKDTHLRGIKIYAADGEAGEGASTEEETANEMMDDDTARLERGIGLEERMEEIERRVAGQRIFEFDEGVLGMPDFMREGEIR